MLNNQMVYIYIYIYHTICLFSTFEHNEIIMQGGHGFKLSNPLNEISLQRFLGHPETVFVKTPQYLCSSVPFCLLVTLSCALLRTSFGTLRAYFSSRFFLLPYFDWHFRLLPVFPCQISQFLGQTLTPYFPHHFQRSMKRVCLKVGYPKPPGSPSYYIFPISILVGTHPFLIP